MTYIVIECYTAAEVIMVSPYLTITLSIDMIAWKVPGSEWVRCLPSVASYSEICNIKARSRNCPYRQRVAHRQDIERTSEASDTEVIMAMKRYFLLPCLALIFLVELVLCQNFELIPRGNSPPVVTLACQNSAGVIQDIDDVQFWLNRTRDDSRDLRSRGDIPVFEDQTRNEISITCSRDIEGFYTCGQQIDSVNFDESAALILVGKY